LNSLRFDAAGRALTLLAGRALHLSAAGMPSTLIVADLHFGKAATFRARGLPVPKGTTAGTLRRLDALLAASGAQRLIVLGDFLHAREAHAADTLAALRAWRARHEALEIVLVEGNHDRHAGAPPADLAIRIEHEPWRLPLAEQFALCHHPQRVADAVVLAGHLHPCIWLRGSGDDSLRLPCFWWQARADGGGLLLLPAFGEFTGGAPIERTPGDRVIAIGDERLFEIPSPRREAA
jgi:DNA ligase-associated metallophosphoesterase